MQNKRESLAPFDCWEDLEMSFVDLQLPLTRLCRVCGQCHSLLPPQCGRTALLRLGNRPLSWKTLAESLYAASPDTYFKISTPLRSPSICAATPDLLQESTYRYSLIASMIPLVKIRVLCHPYFSLQHLCEIGLYCCLNY